MKIMRKIKLRKEMELNSKNRFRGRKRWIYNIGWIFVFIG